MAVMWKKICLIAICVACVPAYAGFLQPTSFPKTIDDLSFIDRLALKRAAYEQFESEYDENGNCISGCAYALPKWEDELAAMERYNHLSRQELVTQHGYTENPDGTVTPPAPTAPLQVQFPDVTPPAQPTQPVQPTQPAQPTQPVQPTPPVVADANCADRNPSFGNRDIPYGNPLGHIVCISSPYGPRDLFGRKFHYGMDFAAPTGTPVYAPANGVVDIVFVQNKSCGNGLVIEHSAGYSTQYCHFSSVSVKKGDKVSAGCLIGKSGNTGQSTGPHLHYSVIKDGHKIDPADFIEPGHKRCH